MVITCECVSPPSQATQRIAHVYMRQGIQRVDLYRLPDKFHGRGVPSVLVLDQSEHVEGVKMIRSLREYFTVQGFSRLQLPLPVMHGCLPKFSGNGCRTGPGALNFASHELT